MSWLLLTCLPCCITWRGLDVRGGAGFCLNVMCHALCKPMGDLMLSEWRWRRNGWGEGKCEMGGENWLLCKIDEKNVI